MPLALWACVVCFSDDYSLVILDRTTEFGSWIDFYMFATSNNSTNQDAYFLLHIILRCKILEHGPLKTDLCTLGVTMSKELKTK